MIRKITETILLFICLFQNINGQDVPKLAIPSSPAFSILNFEPTAIMRPSNAKDLAADVLSSFDENGKLIMNLGLEVTPYWLQSRPKLKREKYLEPSPGQAFLQSFSFSGATVKDSASGDNKLGAGFRFKLYNGHPTDSFMIKDAELKVQATFQSIISTQRSFAQDGEIKSKQEAIDSIRSILLQMGVSQAIVNEIKKRADLLLKNHKDPTSDSIINFLEKLNEVQADHYHELAAEVSDLMYQRKGFILEFAGATGFNTSNGSSLEKIGFWGNASHYVSPDDLFTLTARYMNQKNENNIDTANFDVGLGYLKKADRYNFSVEGMLRWYKAEIPVIIGGQPAIEKMKDFTYRLAIQGSYVISKDISINLNIGKDFDTPFAGSGFFSILGLNYSIFNKKIPELPSEADK